MHVHTQAVQILKAVIAIMMLDNFVREKIDATLQKRCFPLSLVSNLIKYF
jgi:nicotinate-nucleotide pyrophosphorylase